VPTIDEGEEQGDAEGYLPDCEPSFGLAPTCDKEELTRLLCFHWSVSTPILPIEDGYVTIRLVWCLGDDETDPTNSL